MRVYFQRILKFGKLMILYLPFYSSDSENSDFENSDSENSDSSESTLEELR